MAGVPRRNGHLGKGSAHGGAETLTLTSDHSIPQNCCPTANDPLPRSERLLPEKGEPDARSVAQLALDAHPAAVNLDDSPGNRLPVYRTPQYTREIPST